MVQDPPQGVASTTLRARYTAANGAFLVAAASPGASAAESALEAYAQLADGLRAGRLQIVQERVFGSLSAEPAIRAARSEALRARGFRDDTPLNYIQGQPVWGDGFAGAIVHAVPSDTCPGGVRILSENGVPRGRMWQAGETKFFLLQDVRGTAGPDEDNSPAAQAHRAIQRADHLLRAQGASFGQTVRTWFYLADILDWYDAFNRARSAAYRKIGLLGAPPPGRILPASTGIRATLSAGAACSVDVLAVVAPEGDETAVRALRNPRQEEAFHYGSAFSRGAAIRLPGETLVELSGTAAIDERGTSLYPDNVRAQIRCTLDKVVGVLSQAGACLPDLCAATLFIKNAEDAEAVGEELAAAGLSHLPAVCVVADVCRDELLFEIDAEAVVPQA